MGVRLRNICDALRRNTRIVTPVPVRNSVGCAAPRAGAWAATAECEEAPMRWVQVGCGKPRRIATVEMKRVVAPPVPRELTDRELVAALQEGPFEKAQREAEQANARYFAAGGKP